MALIKSNKIPLGSNIPEFDLKDPDGNSYKSSNQFGEKGLLVAFTCNHCPYAIAVWPRLIQLSEHAKEHGINTVGINPNINPSYPEDAPDQMKVKIQEWGIPFPYLIDETQETARAFKAQCTPDLYLFNKDQKLVYHGRVDNNWQDESKVTHEELRDAIDNLITNKPITNDQKPSMGCSIKWC